MLPRTKLLMLGALGVAGVQVPARGLTAGQYGARALLRPSLRLRGGGGGALACGLGGQILERRRARARGRRASLLRNERHLREFRIRNVGISRFFRKTHDKVSRDW